MTTPTDLLFSLIQGTIDQNDLFTGPMPQSGTVSITTTIVVPEEDDIVIPSDVTLKFGALGKFQVKTGKTLAILGPINAGNTHIFEDVDSSGSPGDVVFHNGSEVGVTRTVVPQWFGALGDGSNDDTYAIQAAIDSLGTAGGMVRFPVPSVAYYFPGVRKVDVSSNISLIGSSSKILAGTRDADETQYVFGLDTVSNVIISGLDFEGVESRYRGDNSFSFYGTTCYQNSVFPVCGLGDANAITSNRRGLDIRYSSDVILQQCTFNKMYQAGAIRNCQDVAVDDITATDLNSSLFFTSYTDNLQFSNVTASDIGDCFTDICWYISRDNTNLTFRDITVGEGKAKVISLYADGGPVSNVTVTNLTATRTANVTDINGTGAFYPQNITMTNVHGVGTKRYAFAIVRAVDLTVDNFSVSYDGEAGCRNYTRGISIESNGGVASGINFSNGSISDVNVCVYMNYGHDITFDNVDFIDSVPYGTPSTFFMAAVGQGAAASNIQVSNCSFEYRGLDNELYGVSMNKGDGSFTNCTFYRDNYKPRAAMYLPLPSGTYTVTGCSQTNFSQLVQYF